MNCPCGSGQSYSLCCEPIISGKQIASTPEVLMRSRYTAFGRGDMDYLRSSMVAEHQHEFHAQDVQRWNRDTEWLSLEILDTSMNGEAGEVRFKAVFRHKGTVQSLTERSRFVRRDDRWYYLDGEYEHATQRNGSPKVGRNDPCPCGSGKKLKKCCG